MVDEEQEETKNPAAVALGRLGGTARMKKATQEERKELAQRALDARWGPVRKAKKTEAKKAKAKRAKKGKAKKARP